MQLSSYPLYLAQSNLLGMVLDEMLKLVLYFWILLREHSEPERGDRLKIHVYTGDSVETPSMTITNQMC